MNKEFDIETAIKIYKYLNKNHNVEKKPLFISISNDPDCWKKVYKLELFEQFLFIRYYINDKGVELIDDKNYTNWIDKNTNYLFYDPRHKKVQEIAGWYNSITRHIRYNLLGKFWWKIQYWKLRYGDKWKTIKMNSKWNNPTFYTKLGGNNEKETIN